MSKKKTTSAPAPEHESFNDAACLAGAALAALIEHPDCPSSVHNAILELDTDVFNLFPNVEISLRHSFPKRLAGLLAAESATD